MSTERDKQDPAFCDVIDVSAVTLTALDEAGPLDSTNTPQETSRATAEQASRATGSTLEVANQNALRDLMETSYSETIDPVIASLPGADSKAWYTILAGCYVPLSLYILFAFVLRPDQTPFNSESQLVRNSPFVIALPLGLLLPMQIMWCKRITAMSKSVKLLSRGKFPFSERMSWWLGASLGPWVLASIYLGTKIHKGLLCDGLLPVVPPMLDIALSLMVVALIIVGTMLPLVLSSLAYLKYFGAINSAVKPLNAASLAPSPLLSSATVSGSLLLPVMVFCWACPPFNLLAVPLALAGWACAFREVDKYIEWIKANHRTGS